MDIRFRYRELLGEWLLTPLQSGYTNLTKAELLEGLTEETDYEYEAVITHGGITSYGGIQAFKTLEK